MLRRFISQAAEVVRSTDALGQTTKKVVFSIGNEAADADSIISAFCYSYLMHKRLNGGVDTDLTSSSVIHVPLVSIPKSELRLRRDVQLLLQSVGYELGDLICLDEVSNSKLLRDSQDVSFALLDHNLMSEKVASVIPPQVAQDAVVKEILDHHKDMGGHTNVVGDMRKIAFDAETGNPTAASACTVLYEKFANDELDAEIAKLLLAVILLDSLNMDPVVAKGTPRDQKAIDALGKICKNVDNAQLFQMIRDAKLDIEFWLSLSAAEALCLDYKSFKNSPTDPNLGMASVLLSSESFLVKDDLIPAVDKYFNEHAVDVCIVLSKIYNPGPRHEALFFAKSAEYLQTFQAAIESGEHTADFGFTQFHPQDSAAKSAVESSRDAGFHVAMYKQANVKKSRKQFAPMAMTVFSTST
jgi:exopolyphosphatase